MRRLQPPYISFACSASAESVTKKNATVDIPSVKVSPTAATADAEIQLEAIVAAVTSPQSPANVRTKAGLDELDDAPHLFVG